MNFLLSPFSLFLSLALPGLNFWSLINLNRVSATRHFIYKLYLRWFNDFERKNQTSWAIIGLLIAIMVEAYSPCDRIICLFDAIHRSLPLNTIVREMRISFMVRASVDCSECSRLFSYPRAIAVTEPLMISLSPSLCLSSSLGTFMSSDQYY